MISKFFIEHPIFANVIALVTVIVGGVFLYGLPVAQYPEIVPPTIQVSTRYPGASAEVVAATIGVPMEQAINGVENSIYMSSTSASDGSFCGPTDATKRWIPCARAQSSSARTASVA